MSVPGKGSGARDMLQAEVGVHLHQAWDSRAATLYSEHNAGKRIRYFRMSNVQKFMRRNIY